MAVCKSLVTIKRLHYKTDTRNREFDKKKRQDGTGKNIVFNNNYIYIIYNIR